MKIALIVAGGALSLLAAIPARAERTGREVVEGTCAVCHVQGRDGAPRIGDAKAWGKRASQGLSSLSASALAGIRKMPPHGGNLSLSDLEMQRAIAYMVNLSGGHWAEPIDRARLPAPRSGEEIVRTQCMACHAQGLHGAPRIGDKDAWIHRSRQGFEGVVRSAINGHGGMPARGGMAGLTDEEMRSAVTYMFHASVTAPAKPQ
jgi:cytochrome c5